MSQKDEGGQPPVPPISSSPIGEHRSAGATSKPWIERHPVIVGLIGSVAGVALGWQITSAVTLVEYKVASDASKAWSREFATWKATKELESKRLLGRLDKDHKSWFARLNVRIDADLEEIRKRNAEAIEVSTKAKTTASAVNADCNAAEAELKRLLALSEQIHKDTGDLPQQVLNLLLADAKLLTEPLAKAINAQAPPIGAVMAWPRPVDKEHPLSPNWRICDGTELTKLGLADGDLSILRAALPASIYNNRLPDFQDMFLRGAGLARRAGSRQTDQVGPHKHGNGSLHAAFASSPNAIAWEELRRPKWHSNNGASLNTATPNKPQLQNLGVTVKGVIGEALPPKQRTWSASDETRPVNFAVHWIIRVK